MSADSRLLAQQFHIEDQQANRLHDQAAAFFDCPDCRSINPWYVPRHPEVDLSWINEAHEAATSSLCVNEDEGGSTGSKGRYPMNDEEKR